MSSVDEISIEDCTLEDGGGDVSWKLGIDDVSQNLGIDDVSLVADEWFEMRAMGILKLRLLDFRDDESLDLKFLR